MRVFYTDRARDDLESAFHWYESQRKGLGFEFLDSIEVAIKSILENPEMYRIHYSVFRGYVVRRFPFTIFYAAEGSEIVIHSVFDSRQNPQRRP